MKHLLQQIARTAPCFSELRWHKRTTNSFLAQKGRVDVANHNVVEGVGVRVLVDGAWGFAATPRPTGDAIRKALDEAVANARTLACASGADKVVLARGELAHGDFTGDGFEALTSMPLADKLAQIVAWERELAKSTPLMQTARCRYGEVIEEKAVATGDGACASMRLAQPEMMLSAVVERQGQQVSSYKAVGVAGSWQCLFAHPRLNDLIHSTAKDAVDLLDANHATGGEATVILGPAIVGLLVHEAIGHTVEADLVKTGSVAAGKIGQRVASDLVSIFDTGASPMSINATGAIPFDDEGVMVRPVGIIDKGFLRSYLHSRVSAAEFGVEPTGNARAWLYSDEPLIRMRNTYLAAGRDRLEDMLAELEDGYFIDDAGGGGQADSTGEFMFGVGSLWRIKNGKKVQLLREATLSGVAFDVLKTVDRVSREFRWDLGAGYCGKGQAAKVDAGGPYIRCRLMIGGRQ